MGQPLGKAVVDLERFRNILAKTWDLEKAVKDSVKITYLDGRFKTGLFLDAIWLGLDWGKLIDIFKETDEDEMYINWFKTEYKKWKQYFPGAISKDGRKFTLKEEEKEGEEMILIQSLRNIPFNIKNFVDNVQFSYAFREWELDVSDELLDSGGKSLNNS